jgi:hypothetical protein
MNGLSLWYGLRYIIYKLMYITCYYTDQQYEDGPTQYI